MDRGTPLAILGLLGLQVLRLAFPWTPWLSIKLAQQSLRNPGSSWIFLFIPGSSWFLAFPSWLSIKSAEASVPQGV